jgi:hypothetical protein
MICAVTSQSRASTLDGSTGLLHVVDHKVRSGVGRRGEGGMTPRQLLDIGRVRVRRLPGGGRECLAYCRPCAWRVEGWPEWHPRGLAAGAMVAAALPRLRPAAVRAALSGGRPARIEPHNLTAGAPILPAILTGETMMRTVRHEPGFH